MKILIAGNMGYVGPEVVRALRDTFPQAELVGLDTGFFAHCLTHASSLPECLLDRQLFCDIRDVEASMLEGCTAVVNLAAISNDVMGQLDEKLTHQINCEAGIRLAEMARLARVRHFVFASSCSVYGEGGDQAKKENSGLNPLTAYARSKVESEQRLESLSQDEFRVTCFRFATACGMSSRLRLDLVLNDFVACARTSGKISVLSDGTPWRPLIHVADMARAITWGVQRPLDSGGRMLVMNTGSNAWNCRVRDLAEAVSAELTGTDVCINESAPKDRRSYRVDFSLFETLAPLHQPRVSLSEAVKDLSCGLQGVALNGEDFRDSSLVRLKVLAEHKESGRLDQDLRWNRSSNLAAVRG